MTPGRGERGFGGGLWAGDVNGPNIQIGSATGPVTVVVEHPDAGYRLDEIVPESALRYVPRSQRLPSFMLDGRRGVVPYRDRPAVQASLARWCTDEEPVSLRLLHGPGGAGKSRLAARFATVAYESGWHVLEARDLTSPSHAPATRRTHRPDQADALVVVDYADRWSLERLARMVAALAHGRRPSSTPSRLRILLLARTHQGFWGDVEAAVGSLPVDLAEPIALQGFTDRPDDLLDAFDQASRAFQYALDLSYRPLSVPAGLLNPGPKSNADDLSPLTVHMAALASVCALEAGDPVPEQNDLSRYLLQHEKRYWHNTEVGADVMGTTVLLASLFGPTTDTQQARSLLIDARLAADPAAAERLLAAHARLYPPATSANQRPNLSQPLAPLRPDRFAEDLIATQLQSPAICELTAELLTTDSASAPATRQAFIVLSASAERHLTARSFLFDLLATSVIHPIWLTPNLIRTVIARAAHAVGTRVDDALPVHRTDLLRAACDLNQHLFDTLPRNAPPDERAHRLHNLGMRLSDVGEKHAALKVTKEAVRIRRLLADAEPAEHMPALALSISHLGPRYSEVGDARGALAPAREAVAIYRALIEEESAYLPRLVGALNNLGNCLAGVGDNQGALESTQEATHICRVLYDVDPATGHPILAMSLSNLGVRLSRMGDKEGALIHARESADLYRVLAESEPSVYLPDLAMSLSNLGVRISEIGDEYGAVAPTGEAVGVYRVLVEAEPAAYLPNFAMALTNLGLRLSDIGDVGSALGPAREAVEVFRTLNEREPAAYLPGLGMALLNLSTCLSQSGDGRGALRPAGEALDIYRRLSAAEPEAYMPELATTLGANAWIRETHDIDLEIGLEIALEACALLAQLARHVPEPFVRLLVSAEQLSASLRNRIGK